ncbi:MAG: hypothetical protein MRJ96_08710 [Nitrospirales bacterium]|nr:hypothetical protein [Nitrospira sp.]MDR4501514.1 hypothetical protein [Nitrospirales bacterium]
MYEPYAMSRRLTMQGSSRRHSIPARDMNITDFRRFVVAFIVLALTTVAITWPLVWHLSDALPIGTEHELTVPLLNLWTLWWNATQAMNGFPGYWDAPIFHPSPGTFSFSEPQLFTGILSIPVWWLTDSSATVYNITLLLCLFLNGLCAYRLARSLDMPFSPSLFCGILVIGMPVTAKLLGVLPLIPLFGILWALEGFVWFGKEGSIQSAIWAGLGITGQFLSSQQLMLLFAPFALLAGIIALHQRQCSQKAVITLSGVGLVTILACVGFAWGPLQIHQNQGFTRTDQVVQALSALPGDYVTRPRTALIGFPPREEHDGDTGGLFPGFCVLTLSGLGIVYGLRATKQRRWVMYFLVVGGASVVLSFGLNLSIGGWQPFNTLRTVIPGYHEFRSPFRFAILFQMSLCVFSAFGLWKLWHVQTPFKSVLVLSVVGLLAVLENLAIPQPLHSFPRVEQQEWVSWLREQGSRRVVAHVPFPGGQHVSDYEFETVRMLAQVQHRKRLANGYSGYFPPGYSNFQLDMARHFPTTHLLCFLIQELHVDTIIIDRHWARDHEPQLQTFSPLSKPLYEDPQVKIFSLLTTDSRC